MQYALGRTNSASGTALTQQLANGTKLQTILGRSASGPQVNGFYVEASWKVLDKFALAFALEANDTFPDNNFFVHLEVPRYKNFQFLATLHRRSLGSVSELFKAKSSDTDILIAKGRYRVGNSFHLNIEAITPYGTLPDQLFRNAINVNFNAEFGFGYGSKK